MTGKKKELLQLRLERRHVQGWWVTVKGLRLKSKDNHWFQGSADKTQHGHVSILPAWDGRSKCFESKKNGAVSSRRLHVSIRVQGVTCDPKSAARHSPKRTIRPVGEGAGNTAVWSRGSHVLSGTPKCFLQNPLTRNNTFKHTSFGPIKHKPGQHWVGAVMWSQVPWSVPPQIKLFFCVTSTIT